MHEWLKHAAILEREIDASLPTVLIIAVEIINM